MSANEQEVCFPSNSNVKQKSRLCWLPIPLQLIGRRSMMLIDQPRRWRACPTFSWEGNPFQSARCFKMLKGALRGPWKGKEAFPASEKIEARYRPPLLIYHKPCTGMSANEQEVCFPSNSNVKQKSRLCWLPIPLQLIGPRSMMLIDQPRRWRACPTFSWESNPFQSPRCFKTFKGALRCLWKGKEAFPASEKIGARYRPPSCSSTTNHALECRPMSRRFAFPAIPMPNKNLDYVDCPYLYNWSGRGMMLIDQWRRWRVCLPLAGRVIHSNRLDVLRCLIAGRSIRTATSSGKRPSGPWIRATRSPHNVQG